VHRPVFDTAKKKKHKELPDSVTHKLQKGSTAAELRLANSRAPVRQPPVAISDPPLQRSLTGGFQPTKRDRNGLLQHRRGCQTAPVCFLWNGPLQAIEAAGGYRSPPRGSSTP